ncbi:MAG TPA: bifunctional protein-serine/threonine kinase/phosphatase [Gammaproteobacteria bacterium]|nr:bifunctional protein-serine/threonine kinase/phosphatase [Gammaproteobacteria bacterium]
MAGKLDIDYAIVTEKGDKDENADAADACIPEGGLIHSKGIAAAIADGMSSSEGGKEASQVSVTGFLTDYFSTPESWTVKTSVQRVLGALNRWLYSQGQVKHDSARGMVTTFSGMVLKSSTAHIFHVGDSRIYRFRTGELELLTRDHRVWVSKERDFLSRAMGIDPSIDIDYRSVDAVQNDIFLFTTDGITGHVTDHRMQELLADHGSNLQACASKLLEESLHNGSTDNVTCQLIRVLSVPQETEDDIYQKINELPFPPDLSPGVKIDGYEILRELHASRRSEVFLATDSQTGEKVILKTPSINYRDDPEYLDSFLHEEWVGRRIKNIHVLKTLEPKRRRFLYNISEYVEGQSLRQWIDDHPQTHINTAREYLMQIADGLRAFHRLEMVHQDLKPENILIDSNGTLKIIDFGSTRVAGASEICSKLDKNIPQGTINYTAPECIAGSNCSNRSDMFSFGVIAYELLTGKLPYGDNDKPIPANKLKYISCRVYNDQLAAWVDGALCKAVNPDPRNRYKTMAEFLRDLTQPNDKFDISTSQPLLERNPLLFWKSLSGVLAVACLYLLFLLTRS